MHWTERSKAIGSVDSLIVQARYMEQERKARAFKYKLAIGGIIVVSLMVLLAFIY